MFFSCSSLVFLYFFVFYVLLLEGFKSMTVFIMFGETSSQRFIKFTKDQPTPTSQSYRLLLQNFIATFVKLLLFFVHKKWQQINLPRELQMTHADTVFLHSLRAEARKVGFSSAYVNAGKAIRMIASQEEENGIRIALSGSRTLEKKITANDFYPFSKYIRNNNDQTMHLGTQVR